MLLFLDQEIDLHADRVEAECWRRGIACFRLCTERFPQHVALSVRPADDRLTGRIVAGDQEIALEEVMGVWFRRPAPVELDAHLSEGTLAFARTESEEALSGLYRALDDRRWVSRPDHIAAASHKIHQLRLARHLGFEVPLSLVTNDPGEALRFFEECGREMIYKPMRFVMITDDSGGEHGIYATRIGRDDLEQHLESVRLTPCFFQQYFDKSYELRVNVIGDRVWAASIHSQEHEGTRVDFRTDIGACRHAAIHLPPKLERMCLELTHRLGLRMSNIDVIVTPAGDYVFLEANPNGQWAWIEDMTGLPLCAALVDELLGVDTLAGHPYVTRRALEVAPA
jgi:glutathione synthase/RimK-type ligase-like ATP-grasp enzyme